MKVLLVYDVDGWAWHHKSKAIQKYLGNDFEKITIINSKQFNRGFMSKYHSVHLFGWLDHRGISGKYKGVTAGVSSHNFEYLHPERAKNFLPKYDAITAVSKILYNKLKQENLNNTIYYCPNGVDETIFRPEPIEHEKFVVGWSGQPSGKGFNKNDGLDMHGYHNVLLPLVESLRDEPRIVFDIMTKTHKTAISFDQMPKFYNGLDLFVHTGLGTGTPNPLFESAACGVPGISTAIGEAPELITDGYNGFVFPRFYNKDDARLTVLRMRSKILELLDKGTREMGMNAREEIENNWTWEKRARNWLPVFNNHQKRI